VILAALSQILLYFLRSLLRFNTLVQDIILQTVCNSGLGFLVLWMIPLFALHPLLPLAVLVSVSLLVILSCLASGKVKMNPTTVTASELQDLPQRSLEELPVTGPRDLSPPLDRIRDVSRSLDNAFIEEGVQSEEECIWCDEEDDLCLSSDEDDLFHFEDELRENISSSNDSD
jgi:hypothetical protein